MHKKISLVLAVIFMVSLAVIPASALTITSNQQSEFQRTGTVGNVDYEYWIDKGQGSMTINNDGSFSCEWRNVNNSLFRVGKRLGSSSTHSQLGQMTMDYTGTYSPSGTSYLSVYGWFEGNQLVEYYIVENWNSYNPSSGATRRASYSVGGASYQLYTTSRNGPSIKGNTTFQQYYAVRDSKRSSGSIDITAHFKAWENAGLSLGRLYECTFVVEGWQCNGNANISRFGLKIGNNTYGTMGSGGGGGGGNGGGGNTGTDRNCPAGHPKAYYNADGHNCSANCGRLDWENHNYVNNVCAGCGHNRGGGGGGNTTTTTRPPTTTTPGGGGGGSNGNTRIECENMTRAGQYTAGSSSFGGVTLYANDDRVSFNHNFSANSNTFTLRGRSTTSSTGQVRLEIGGTNSGTFQFQGTTTRNVALTVSHNRGGQNNVGVTLRCINDNNTWDVELDYIEINGGSSGGGGNTTTTTRPPTTTTPSGGGGGGGSATRIECENMTRAGQYTGNASSFGGVTLYANDDRVSTNQTLSGNRHQFSLRAKSNQNTAQVRLEIGGTNSGTYYFGNQVGTENLTVTHNRSGQNTSITLRCVNDNNTWDVELDWLEIRAA